MRYRRLILPLLVLLALCCACAGQETALQADYVLYFLTDEQAAHGSALSTEPYALPGEEAAPDPGALLEALTAGPQTEGLRSPFPTRTAFQWWEWDPERPGHLRVGMSEQYGGLTDISLTLADYCIVLTLSQVEGVESVEITAQGHWASYRSHQQMAAGEAVLRDELADVGSAALGGPHSG